MENSSSSKTRSPARVLAALLAVVMLFIVMPVLPAAAAAKVNKIVFTNVADLDTGDNIIFNPNNPETETVNGLRSKQQSGKEAAEFDWTGGPDSGKLQFIKADNDIEVTRKENKEFASGWGGAYFTFALYTSSDEIAYYSVTSASGPWLPLTSTETVRQYEADCKKYTIPQGGMGETKATDIYIKIDKVKPTYTVTFSVDPDATVKVGSSGESIEEPVYSGDTFDVVDESEEGTGATLFLDVTGKTGYTPIVRVSNGLTAEYKNGSYEIANITKNIIVTVSLEKETYTVSKNNSDAEYTVSIKTPQVSYNDSAEFSVQVPEGHQDPTVTIRMGEKPLSAGEGTYTVTKTGSTLAYTIYHVTGDVVVTVKKAGMIQHTVTVALGEGFTVEVTGENTKTSQTVDYGTKFNFTVKPAEGWETTTPIVTANGTQILPQEGGNKTNGWKYSVEIKADTTISVSNFKRKTYTVTITNDTEKYNLTYYPSSVEHGQGFTFTLNLTTAYEAKTGITVKNNDMAIEGDDPCTVTVTSDGSARSYTIKVTNVKDDLSLSFDGIDIKKYTVTVMPEDGSSGLFTVNGKEGKESDTATEKDKKYGSGVSFTIKPKDGCRIENVSVYGSEGVALSGVMVDNKDGTYSIGNVTDNYTIKVRAVAVKFTIAIQSSAATTVAGDEAPMNALVVTKTYTTIKNGGIVTYKNGVFELKLPTVTRPGHVFDGWTRLDGSEIVDGTLRFYGDNDQAETVVANWKVDVAAGESAYFVVTLDKFTWSEGGVTRFEADFKTNAALDKNPENAGAYVLSHGFFYARSEAEYNAALKDLSKVIEKLENGVDQKLTNLDAGVAYYLHDDGDGVDAFKGGKFNLSLSGTAKGTAVGSAWVLVSINGETYLFVSAMRPVA